MNIKQTGANLPKTTGVYLFKNTKGKVLYVGKANNLKTRVKQYFSGQDTRPKIKYLIPQIADIQTIQVNSEFEALLLEATLIKKYQPKFNSAAKDDKHPLYIAITKEEFPKVRLARRSQDLGVPAELYGPFPSANTVRQVLKFIRRTFPYCSCKSNKGRPCLYASIGLCHPCPRVILPLSKVEPKADTSKNITKTPKLHQRSPSLKVREGTRESYTNSQTNQPNNEITKQRSQYRKQINLLKKLLKGDAPTVLTSLEKEMKRAAKNKDFETAAYYRDGLQNLKYLLHPNRPTHHYLDNPNLRMEIRQEALRQLKNILNSQEIKPKIKKLHRIECYDISTLSGKYSTGSMVVFTDGQPDKSQYRRFKIKGEGLPRRSQAKAGKPNDVQMITEMLERRFRRDVSLKRLYISASPNSTWPTPDLLVLDGGKPQLNAALKVLKKQKINIPAIGLAKKLEEIYIPTLQPRRLNSTSEAIGTTKLLLPKSNTSLHILQHLRDEAHRFANSYRKKLISQNNTKK